MCIRSLTTRLYNFTQSNKLPSQMFLQNIVLPKNKGNTKGLQTAIKCIIPHAFGEHENCGIAWCRFKEDPISYKHRDLPHGKDLFGLELRPVLYVKFRSCRM
jgi:hypothetical protein